MENSLIVIFDEIWPKTMYYSTGNAIVHDTIVHEMQLVIIKTLYI